MWVPTLIVSCLRKNLRSSYASFNGLVIWNSLLVVLNLSLIIITCFIFFPCNVGVAVLTDAMAIEERETSNGWPLGLDVVSVRLGVVQNLQPEAPGEPQSFHFQCQSFSSFSSSNLDTESTASFFQDNSVPLGQLIGIRGDDAGKQMPRRIRVNGEKQKIAVRSVRSQVSRRGNGVGMSRGICIPLLLGTLEKMSKSKSKSKS